MSSTLRCAMIGAGFWARYQLSGWREAGVECIAICNRTVAKAEAIAREFGIPAVFSDAGAMLEAVHPDFVDVVTDVDTHRRYVELAASRGLPAVCQKPLAPTLADAEATVAACRSAGVPLFVNENWRWQTPIRQVEAALASGAIGKPFRARIDMISGFPVFANQPFLRTLEQFILTDLGSHVLDAARFLFGEASTLYCHTARVHPDIRGEDVATVMLRMHSGATVLVEMAYAENYLERDSFPETFLFVEGDRGSIELGPGYWLRVTTAAGTHARRCPPPRYEWANPAYAIVHASIVPCQRNLAEALRGRGKAETTGDDNLRTVRLVFAAYESARTGEVISL
jgi:D-apiose dehydrogenase